MADDDSRVDPPSPAPSSLTPPSLGLSRLRRRRKTPADTPVGAPADTPADTPVDSTAATPSAPSELSAPSAPSAPSVDTPPVDTPPVDSPPVDTPPVDFAAPADVPPPDAPPVDTAPIDGDDAAAADVPAVAARRQLRVPGRVAAVVTGLFIGLLIVLSTSGAGRGCDAVSNSGGGCGNAGLLFLVLILGIAIVVGGLLLRLLRVSDPVSTSFLAVGLTAVVALLFLSGHLESWWMVIAIPVVSMATYALSHWVTENFGDPTTS